MAILSSPISSSASPTLYSLEVIKGIRWSESRQTSENEDFFVVACFKLELMHQRCELRSLNEHVNVELVTCWRSSSRRSEEWLEHGT